jgi:hypothetical protein
LCCWQSKASEAPQTLETCRLSPYDEGKDPDTIPFSEDTFPVRLRVIVDRNQLDTAADPQMIEQMGHSSPLGQLDIGFTPGFRGQMPAKAGEKLHVHSHGQAVPSSSREPIAANPIILEKPLRSKTTPL